MAQLKCKMCGAAIEVNKGDKTITCDYCGSLQTVPQFIDDAKINSLHNRANTLRLKNEFDKAILTYENLVNENPRDAEAHFGLLLSRYGIEYVDDKKTGEKIPTCHRTLYKSIFDDIDYKAAIENSDVISQRLYQEEATKIDKLQKEIIHLMQNENPYDIFICYKENDEDNKRTRDSVIAQELYDELTKKDYKVFFSKITLESKLGSQYEPYIFSALNTAKVMIVIGTKPEYFNSVWVRNEWSRFLSIMNDSKEKKYLIPCYKDMDIYDLPNELIDFQAQDMNKLGFLQDILRGLDKIFGKDVLKKEKTTPVLSEVDPMLERALLLISDGEYKKASSIIDNVLNKEPKNAKAYLYLYLADTNSSSINELSKKYNEPENNYNYKRFLKYADESFKNSILDRIYSIIYNNAKSLYEKGRYEDAIVEASRIKSYEKATILLNEIYTAQKKKEEDEAMQFVEKEYQMAIVDINNKAYYAARKLLKRITFYKDVKDLLKEVEYQISIDLYKSKKYREALVFFEKYPTYKSSKKYQDDCNFKLNLINHRYIFYYIIVSVFYGVSLFLIMTYSFKSAVLENFKVYSILPLLILIAIHALYFVIRCKEQSIAYYLMYLFISVMFIILALLLKYENGILPAMIIIVKVFLFISIVIMWAVSFALFNKLIDKIIISGISILNMIFLIVFFASFISTF